MRVFNNLKERLFLSLFLFSFLLVLLVTMIIYQYSSNQRNKESEKYFIEKVDSVSVQLDALISKMDTVSSQLLASKTLQKMFIKANSEEYDGKNYFDYNIDERKTAQDILWTFNSPKRQVESVNIFSASSYVGLIYSPSQDKVKSIAAMPLWNFNEKDGKKYHVIGPHEDSWNFVEAKEVISLVRPFTATGYNFVDVGAIEVQEKYSKIEEICNVSELEDNLNLLVVDGQRNIIYQNRHFSEGQITDLYDNVVRNKQDKLFKVKQNGTEWIATYKTIKNMDWSVFLIQPTQIYYQPVKEIMLFVMVFSLILMIVIFLFLKILIDNITKPVLQLASDMNQVSDIDHIPSLHKSSVQEIQVLQNNFMKLLERIKESTNELIIAHESELNLRIMGMQARINPHFLFNSLTAISAVAEEEKCNKVPVMCYQLSELFRYSSNDESSRVTLKSEMDYIRTYLDFMKWRYEDNFSFEIEEEGDLALIEIAKMTLQPLVENSFTHGFKKTYPPYRIKITCKKYDKGWYFYIADNGIGFSAEIIKQLREELIKIDSILKNKQGYNLLKTHNMAILNIYIRLKIQYKEALWFEIIQDMELKGALVKITVDYSRLGSF